MGAVLGRFVPALLFLMMFGFMSPSNIMVRAASVDEFLIREIPYVRQDDPYWCGPASLSMVLNYWGVNVSQMEIAADIYDPKNHLTSISNMTEYPEQLGFRTEELQGSINHIKNWTQKGQPLIVLQKFSLTNTYGHYRVIVGYDQNVETIITYDPIKGKDYNISYNDFAELWAPGSTFSTLNWTLRITPLNDVLTHLMEEKQLTLNLEPSNAEQSDRELSDLRNLLNELIATSVLLAAYSLTITIIHFRRRQAQNQITSSA